MPSRRRKADAFLRQYARAFGAPYAQLVRDGISKDRHGSTVSYTQRYRGIPVFGTAIRVHIDEDGDLTSVNGALAPVRNLSMTRTVSARQAALARRGSRTRRAAGWQTRPTPAV